MDVSYKPQIDKLILNYFIQENYKQAAGTFARETNTKLSDNSSSTLQKASISYLKEISGAKTTDEFVDVTQRYTNRNGVKPIEGDKSVSTGTSRSRRAQICKGYSTINERAEIKYLILKGHITEAIEKISEYFPTVLDSNNVLHFRLLRLNLIEMIRTHKLSNKTSTMDGEVEKKFLDEVLNFVRTKLINKVTDSYKLLRDLEITMSLLCFNFDDNLDSIEDQKDLPEELRALFDFSLRSQCYKLVNKAILNLNRLEKSGNAGVDGLNDMSDFKHDQINYDQLKDIGDESREEFDVAAVDTDGLQKYLSEYATDDVDVDMEGNEEEPETQRKSKDTILKEEAIEDEAKKLQDLAFDSKLERLIKLWALTVQRKSDLMMEEKKFELNKEL